MVEEISFLCLGKNCPQLPNPFTELIKQIKKSSGEAAAVALCSEFTSANLCKTYVSAL